MRLNKGRKKDMPQVL